MIISKKISGRKYYYFDQYYVHEEALEKALELKKKAKKRGDKIRTYIEEVQVSEFFLPTRKFYLWIND